MSVCCHFVASFYHCVTNIVTQFVTSVVLSNHLVAIMWLSYVRQSNYIATLLSLSQFVILCCHVTDMVIQLVTHCRYLVVICVWFARNITKIVALCQFRFVGSFYHHVTNIVVEFVTSVVLSYHLVAVMWLSYVGQSNYIVTLTSLSPFLSACLLSCNCRGRRTCHTLSPVSCHLCMFCPTT